MSGDAEHAVDVGVRQRLDQPGEQRAPVGHRHRVAARCRARPARGGRRRPGTACRARRAAGRAGGARRRRAPTAPGSRAPVARAAAATARRSRLGPPARRCVGRRLTVMLALLARRRARRARSRVGMASAHASREATMAPAALAYSAMRTGSQPASRPWTSAPPKASPAPSPQTTSTGCGATTVAAVRRGDEDALAAHLDQGELDAAVEQPVGGLVRVAVPTATSTSARLPTTTVTCVEHRVVLARAPPPARARTSAASRGRARCAGREPGAGRPRCSSIASCVVRAGSTLTPVPVTQSTGTSRTRSHGTSSCVERQVGRDRQAVEQQRRVLRRVELAEHHRRQQVLGRADVRRVDAEPGRAPRARSRRTPSGPTLVSTAVRRPAGPRRRRRWSPSRRGTSRRS